MEIKAKDRQTLLDIGLIYGGEAEAAMTIAIMNGLSLTDTLAEGQSIKVPDPPDPNTSGRNARRTVELYALERIDPATEISEDERAACPCGGIGFMGIEIDFKVS